MKVTTYTCDRCGHHQSDDNQMWSVGIVYQNGDADLRADYYAKPRYQGHKKLWCRACMGNVGLVFTLEEAKSPAPESPVPTLEEMIREIAREEIASMTGAS